MKNNHEVAGRNLLITGANRGLGAALVSAAFERGAAKIYCGARNLDSFGSDLHPYEGRAVPIQLDITKDADVAEAARLDDVDIVVSNAGVTYMVPLMETTLDGARATMEANYFGPLRLIYGFGQALQRRRGGFISILSLAGLVPARDAELYSASKAAGMMLGHAARAALPDVKVALAYPGLMDTDMMRVSDFPKTPPHAIAAAILDGWARGEGAVFPDRHSQCLRDEFVSRSEELLTNPYALMTDSLMKFLSLQKI